MTPPSAKSRGLGRGLDALFTPAPATSNQATQGESATSAAESASSSGPRGGSRGGMDAFIAKIEELHPNREQPRTHFDDAALDELAASIRELGVLEPILVRRRTAGGYEIVAGERRWRAAQRAGLHDVPVLCRELSDSSAFEAALVENLQREDLNPLETARAFQRLIEEHAHTQESVAKLTGKDRSTIANALRLLKLPEAVLDLIANGDLTEGHGRALLGAGDVQSMVRMAREAVAKSWSVRETERRVRGITGAKNEKKEPEPPSANVRDLEERLTRALGARVSVSDRKGHGHVQVTFSSYDELDRLLEIFLADASRQ